MNKFLVISGAKGMLGQELVDHFAEIGYYDCILSLDQTDNSKPKYKNENFTQIDITSDSEVELFFKKNFLNGKSFSVINLINCAAISVFEDYSIRTKSDFMRVLEVNVYGSFNTIQKTVSVVREVGASCSIVNTSSLFASRSPDERNYVDLPRKNSEVYGASKAGVEQMTRYFAAHLGAEGIRVNCVSPGGILNRRSPQGPIFQKLYNQRVPMARMGENYEMVSAYDYLISSERSGYVNGQILHVDGGYTAW